MRWAGVHVAALCLAVHVPGSILVATAPQCGVGGSTRRCEAGVRNPQGWPWAGVPAGFGVRERLRPWRSLRGGGSAMLDPEGVVEEEEEGLIEDMLAAEGYTEDYFRACEGSGGEGPMSDHLTQFWDDAATAIAKHAKGLQRTLEKVSERAAAVAHAALDGMDAQADLAEQRDAALRALYSASERAEPDAAEVEAAEDRLREAAEALSHSIASNIGLLLVLLRRLRSLDRASKLVLRLSEGGVLEDLAAHVSRIPARRGLDTGVADKFLVQERDTARVEADYWLHELEVDAAERVAAFQGAALPASLPQFREAEGVLRGMRETKDTSGVLAWCARRRGLLARAGVGGALPAHCRLQQCIEMLRGGDEGGARGLLAEWEKFAEGGEEEEALRVGRWLLAADPRSDRAAPYWSMERWVSLERSLKDAAYALYGPTGHSNSLMVMLIAAGLVGLKTHNQAGPAGGLGALRGFEEAFANGTTHSPWSGPGEAAERRPKELRHAPLAGKTPDHDVFYRLAQSLPFSSRPSSVLLCPFTGRRMDEGDPPCRLPNGYLMAKSTVERVCAEYEGRDRTLWEWLELDALIGGYEEESLEGGDYFISQVIAA